MRPPANPRTLNAARKWPWIGALSALMAACGGAVPPPEPASAPRASTSPVEAPPATTASAQASAPETPDAPFRYVPPELGQTPAPLLTAQDLTLANGLTARLVESRTSPIVGANVFIRWKTIAKIPGAGAVLAAALDQVKTASGQTLMDAMRDLGASYRSFSTQDGMLMRIVALPALFESALSLALGTLRNGKFDKAIVEEARSRIQKEIDAEGAGAKAQRRVDARVFASGTRYHDAAIGTAESIAKLSPAEVMRFRDAALAPDGVAVACAGAVTKPDLAAALERVAGGWKAAPKAKEAAPAEAARGVFLIDEPDEKAVHVVVSVPLLMPARADFAASLVATSIFVSRSYDRLRATAAAHWEGVDRTVTRASGRTLEWVVDASSGTAVAVAEAALRAMDDIAKGAPTDAEIVTARRAFAKRILTADGIDALLLTVSEELGGGASPGALLGVFSIAPSIPREDLLRTGAALFRKDRATVVAWGRVAAEKVAFEKLGIGKVVVDVAPKSAPAKSGGKR